MTNIGEAIKLKGKSRIYHFPGGDKVELTNLIELIVRDSGNHRIKMADKKLHIVPTDWLHIEIEDEGERIF